MRHGKLVVAALAVVSIVAVPAMGQIYELVPWSTVNGGGSSTSHFAQAIEGQTSYHQLTLNYSPRVTRVDNLDGVQTMTELVSTAQWGAAGGSTTSMSAYYGFGISGDNLQFAETSTDSVWRVNKSTGAITQYVSKADIMALTGLAGAACLSASEVNPVTGEHAFYEGSSDSILITTGQNTVSVLVSDLQLAALQGNDSVSGGMGYTSGGDLYWGSSTSDAMYMRASDGTLSEVLTTAQITAVSGGTSVSFGDVFPAPDGLVYFKENSGDNILSFDPSNPAGTLAIEWSNWTLDHSVIGTDGVTEMSWYDDGSRGGNLAVNRFNEYGLFVLPEPASLALLALGGLAVLRRRR